MPGFGSILSEDDRWALVDYIHAWNLGRQIANTGRWSPPMAAPSMPLRCADRDADTLADLATHVVVVDVEPDPATEPAPFPWSTEHSEFIMIRLPRGTAEKPRTGECVAASDEAWGAWQLLSGVAADRFGGFRGIVDGQGWLRAWLPPGTGLVQVLAAIRDARDHPIVSVARLAHHH